ncbi:YdcF family protein [Romboutsia ilealis]|uniref:YdcF family protein n=1 Tax=Romboutsia faecis TaxID=2764597 RepID=A0ABR7JMV5_9FIRM|nr:YdcF family protein [Romboutsia faecis]MBC5996239.1 YdcF family protein [Romboutsia faecis]MRN25118.1 YdcF family protein [Romboutsia ilealis]
MSKNIYGFIISILSSILILSINGVNFSALFIIVSIWIVYIYIILNQTENFTTNKIIKTIFKIYKSLVYIFFISMILIESIIIINMNHLKEAKDIEKLDNVIVLGAGLDGYSVGKTLKSRLDKAIEYYKLNEDVNIIVSGGQGEDELISEAEAMNRYLIENGVNKEQIIKEDKATTTLENILYSKEILKKLNYEDKKVLIVTNEFHITRAMVIANILGVKNEGLSSETPLKIRVNYLIREYPTMVIDILRTSYYSFFK